MRSDILVHWTGKDIKLDKSGLQDKDREGYISRLRSILENGFWMTTPNERIEGNNGAWIKYEASMTCFTEIRLSQTTLHSKQYGLLGVGVSRQFVLDRRGGPVHYVRNHKDESIVGNVQAILDDLQGDVRNYFAINTAFMKAMSDTNEDNFKYLEEQEWRIVQTNSQVNAGKIIPSDGSQPAYWIPIQIDDVRIVVFPDDKTLTMARSDPTIKDLFQDPSNSNVILLTLEECEHF
ncbi:MAG: hypothetical protein IH984_13865 [Planctomycetes bacterium]|nr:hypothetical protein [Planctomycetota bacterium]